MATESSSGPGLAWLYFSLLTVACWGVYGVFLHSGIVGMTDPTNGRIKAFLFVGLAYFLTAVLAPMAILASKGASLAFWSYPSKGLWWSLIAGIVGAVGALGVLLAFGAKGKPPEVMAIVFAGAPIINALVGIAMHPPQGGFAGIKPQFYLGAILALAGGALVTLYKPNPPAPTKPAVAVTAPGNVGK